MSLPVVARLRAAGCVHAEDEAALLVGSAAAPAELAAMLERRAAGEPLEHVLGWGWFGGLRVAVGPGVFVPRRRTELLLRAAGGHAAAGAVVLDLCCGSGALGVALAARVAGLEVHAVDIDPVAARCARRNLAVVGGRVYEGDLYAPLPVALRGRVDILVANAPYVPTSAIPLLPREARCHEPRSALDGGADGLDVQRRVIAGAPPWLAPGGWVMVETSARQAPLTAVAFRAAGLDCQLCAAAENEATVVVGALPGARPTPPVADHTPQ